MSVLARFHRWLRAALPSAQRLNDLPRVEALDHPRVTETILRTVEWGFGRRRRRSFQFVVPGSPRSEWSRWVDRIGERTSSGPSCSLPVVWWVGPAPLPAAIARGAGRSFVVVATAASLPPESRSEGVVLADNSARVIRRQRLGEKVMELGGAAALVQAIVSTRGDGPWLEVEPPRGFDRLTQDVRLSEFQARAARGLHGPIAATGNGLPLFVHAGAIRKLAGAPLYVVGPAWTARPGRRFGMNEELERGRVIVDFPEEAQEWADPQTTPHVVYFSGLEAGETPRTGEALEHAFVEYTAESVEDLLRQMNVRISADVKDPDGNDVSIGCRATGVRSFDEAGLTESIPELYSWYVRTRVYDEIHASGRTQLTPDELQRLEAEIEALEEFTQGGGQ